MAPILYSKSAFRVNVSHVYEKMEKIMEYMNFIFATSFKPLSAHAGCRRVKIKIDASCYAFLIFISLLLYLQGSVVHRHKTGAAGSLRCMCSDD